MDRIILLTGDDGVGKDTVAEMLRESIKNTHVTNIKSSCVRLYNELVGVNWNNLSGAEKRIHRPVFSNLCEGIKVTLGKEVFAERTVNTIYNCPDKNTLFIIPDLRFIEEYNVFNNHFDITLVEVKRTEGSLIKDNLNDYIDFKLDNSGDKQDTQSEVDRFLEVFEF